MTKIIVPLPTSPFLAPGQVKGTQVVSREWQRFFTLLLEAVGGDTNIIIDTDVLVPPADPNTGIQTVGPFDLSGADAGEIEALRAQVNGLDPQATPPQGDALLVRFLSEVTPFGMPPTELGHLEAAKNAGYRIAASGNAVLVAGTVTVSNVNANSANEFLLTAKVVGGTQGILSVGTVTANVSFVINSSNAADTSTVSWCILKAIG